jgi:microsomal dipeptidase-like Zn-dependent dipeptidase
MNGTYYADALAFLDHPGKPIIADSEINLDMAHVTVAPPMPIDEKSMLAMVEKSVAEIESQPKLHIVRDADDIGLAESLNKTAIVMGLQNSPTDGHFKELFKAGIRVFGLWYQDRNVLGGGFNLPDEPITAECRTALRELADLGVIVDLSHAGHASARGVIRFMDEEHLPIELMASHGGCHSVYPHLRNLTDDILEDIVDRSGIVGVYTLTFGLSASDDTLAPFIRHLERMVTVAGAENVCIGSDGVYRRTDERELLEQFNNLNKLVKPDPAFNVRYPAQPLCTYSPLKMSIIERKILERGSSRLQENISQIMGENLKNFFERSLP